MGEQKGLKELDLNGLKHIAFIMDGNGRWAKRRGAARSYGHRMGYEAMRKVLQRCVDLKIAVVSVYAFSTENWNRPQEEIDEIFRIIRDFCDADRPMFMKNNIRLVTMGDTTRFPQDLQDKLAEVKDETKNNTGLIFNIGINYGGRAEIIKACNDAIAKKRGQAKWSGTITEFELAENLYTADLPAPDLIVRTSGEQRVSNFMLWQMAYSEFLFIRVFWPAMNEKIVDRCVRAYAKRDRRFGKLK